MKNHYIPLLLLGMFFLACEPKEDFSSTDKVNWDKRIATPNANDSLVSGSTYLSIYSQIYSFTEHRKHDLTATISMRNISRSDTVYISKAVYYNTHGKPIRTYFDQTIYLAPMETVEIVIDEIDKVGGTGANFIFDWKTKPAIHPPYFEGVMISTSGQQGLSFTTQGIRIE
ncbi:DUF3124 domain-containing protein [Flavobacteriaceae bacterium F08102]|nr:DUF3124 domain-containing protein [Flavobacteriaceae bacterium F08102]